MQKSIHKKIITTLCVCAVILISLTLLLKINSPKYGVFTYDLGDTIYTDSSGRKVVYPLTGMIGVSKSVKNAPVVFILHDDHEISSLHEDTYFKGYEYMVKAMADSGFIAVSLNINGQYYYEDKNNINYEYLTDIYEKTLDQIAKANQTKRTKLGADLKDKADLSNINVIGYGNASQAAIELASQNPDTVKSLLMVCPTQSIADGQAMPDIPTAILVSEYGKDANTLYGYTYFDSVNHDSQRQSTASITLLKGANFNYYNALNQTDDAKDVKLSRLSGGDQRYFTSVFGTEFIRSLSKKSRLGVFNTEVESDEKLFGYSVLTTTLEPNRLYLLNANQDVVPNSSLGTPLVLDEQLFMHRVTQYPPGVVSDLLFSHPLANFKSISMYEITLQENVGKKCGLDIAIPLEYCNFSNFSGMGFYIAQNPHTKLTTENLKMDLILTDASGKKATVSMDNMSALNYDPKKNAAGLNITTPLSGARVLLSQFWNIDLEHIVSVRLQIKNISCDVMLHSMYLYQN